MSGHRRLTAVPLPSGRAVRRGDELAPLILEAASAAGVGLRDGDVVCVASKVVSKAEGAFADLPADEDPEQARRRLARERSSRVVADADAVLVTETLQGYVCANGGIDRSNLDAEDRGRSALLLPEDPDASARGLRERLTEAAGARVGVLVTDTFGRPWRLGQTDVALGAAGLRVLRDERGRTDWSGHELAVTLVGVADEVAAAADLTRDKAAGVPFVLVRGEPALASGDGTGRELLRPPDEDLFPYGWPTAASAAVTARRTIRSFTDREVPQRILDEAVAAAATAPAPHGTRPWRFLQLVADTRSRLLDAMADQWRADLRDDGTDEATIEERIARSDAILRDAPELLLPLVSTEGSHDYPDQRRTGAERDMFMLAGGAGLQNLQVVLAAHGVGAAWISSTLFCAPTVREVLDLPSATHPLGMLAVGFPEQWPPERTPRDPGDYLTRR